MSKKKKVEQTEPIHERSTVMTAFTTCPRHGGPWGDDPTCAECTTESGDPRTPPEVQPVTITAAAHRGLAEMFRVWAGWRTASVQFVEPDETESMISDIAVTNIESHTVKVNADGLVLNPNRVVRTATPYALRKEPLLTGVLMHEACHARFTKWPKYLKHGDGSDVHPNTLALAQVMEEPHIEYRMRVEAPKDPSLVTANSLAWTMRAAQVALAPPTAPVGATLLDLIQSYLLRAGRWYGVANAPKWVEGLENLLRNEITAQKGAYTTQVVMASLRFSITAEDATGQKRVDMARTVLEALYDDPEDAPTADDPHGEAGATSSTGESGESGEAGASSSTEAGEGEGEGEGSGSGSGDELSEETAAALAKLEQAANEQATDSTFQEAEAQSGADEAEAQMQEGSGGTGAGTGPALPRNYRASSPTVENRAMKTEASRFLRDLLDPSETNVQTLSESPSATVDPAAMAAWKAGGQVKDPIFFRRTRRDVRPAPPVRIAILVDVSGSMDSMQRPSAELSWALAEAALDLRNFAGRGRQVESCLVHWGSAVQVVQRPGDLLPGVLNRPCNEGTDVLPEAMDAVEKMMPGFFDSTGRPENRLMVNFTDWYVSTRGSRLATDRLVPAIESGLRVLSVVPERWSPGYSMYNDLSSRVSRDKLPVVVHHASQPNAVWDTASNLLK